ncbi:hypothetical protein LXM94_23660 [Rhizobium sp. TRM95111]|uniref:hypothetical protein n=1 Tax=Rhizobium alarense TaxID=2846851 RepID=UPI001F208245|nr:hypothetical protein [Rhizobium alarense]MCF3642964.1 hypothetical protein [Rhizobium alarense]
MTDQKNHAETTVDRIRRDLAKADTAAAVLAAGAAIPDLIAAIEVSSDALDDALAAEAESVDRTRANELRAERAALSDLLTDAEYLGRRIEEKHRALLRDETEAAMRSRQASAMAKQAAAQMVLAKLSDPLRAVVAGVTEYQCLAAEIEALNNELRAGDRHELCVRSPLHALTRPNEDLGGIFGLVRGGKLAAAQGGSDLLEIAARAAAKVAGK